MRVPLALSVAVVISAAAGPAHAQKDRDKEKDKELATKAVAVFAKYCASCHGKGGNYKGGIDYILDVPKLLQTQTIVPGKPDESRPVIRMKEAPDEGMPPGDAKERPTPAEIEVVAAWIAAGAPAPDGGAGAIPKPVPPAKRAQKGTLAVFQAIHADLSDSVLEENRPYQRYFTLTNLYNTAAVTDAQLQVHRAALAKVINSLSWRADVVIPRTVDPEGTILAIDIRDLDWDRNGLWDAILDAYPYGLTHDQVPDNRPLNTLAKQVTKLMDGVEVPFVRADWFVSTATRPPLYHTLLYDKSLPELRSRKVVKHPDFNVDQRDKPDFNPARMTALDLEERLGVNVADNFRRGVAKRAGFTVSGVSDQNRLVERHPSHYGAYWKSYDFKPVRVNEQGNLFKFPLGPAEFFVRDVAAQASAYPKLAFRQDGGEIIFNLPNGLQGYLLLNGKDQRIDTGPADVVHDVKGVTGNPIIVNGISCMTCHTRGMKTGFKDEVAAGAREVGGDNIRKIRQLYPEGVEMNKLLQRDEKRYLAAVETAGGIYLRGSGAEQTETVTAVAKPYLTTRLDATAVAIELGLFNADGTPDAARVKSAVLDNTALKDLGLGTLANGGVVPRPDWEAPKSGKVTTFQLFARAIRAGTPSN